MSQRVDISVLVEGIAGLLEAIAEAGAEYRAQKKLETADGQTHAVDYVATDASYFDFKNYDGLIFPSVIRIWRPQEEYSVTLTIEKMSLNQPLTNEQFVLNQPPGSQFVHLDSATPTAASDGTPGLPPR